MSNTFQLTEDQKKLIERIGVQMEKMGNPPAPSRIQALLLVSPVTELSFDEIRESLNLSKSATSNAINLLMNNKQIDYITRPGERKRYFKNTIASWRTSMEDAFEKLTVGADIFEEVLKQRPAETPEFNHSLREIIDFMRFVNEEMPKLYKKWQEERN